MECDICNDGKDYKNVKQHKRMKHPELFSNSLAETPPEVLLEEVWEKQGGVLLESGSSYLKAPHPDIEANPVVIELRQQVAQLVEALQSTKPVGKSDEDIAKIIYTDVVKVLGDEHSFVVQEWGAFDPAGYLNVARKIKG